MEAAAAALPYFQQSVLRSLSAVPDEELLPQPEISPAAIVSVSSKRNNFFSCIFLLNIEKLVTVVLNISSWFWEDMH